VDQVSVVEVADSLSGEVIREKRMDVELAKAKQQKQRKGVDVNNACLQVGDLIRVKPGEQIALDGVVETGTTSVDESCLTGEPQLVPKQPGDEV
jgi:Cu+-exporting ATPase